MIDLKQIHDMWAEDSQIKMQLDESSRETPKLHAKYLELLSTTKLSSFDHTSKWLASRTDAM